jgi:putative acetyltransferase
MSGELVQLPSFYISPGFILLATANGQTTGCIGLRAMNHGVGEIRRLFVQPNTRGSGLGRRLMERLMTDAKAAGFSQLVLNTIPTMSEACRLYESLGFDPIPRYHLTTTPGVMYFGLDLPRTA